MNTNLLEQGSVFHLRWLALASLVVVAGCFSKPSLDVANRICTADQQCPVGYSCLAPGKAGGCCKPGSLICPAPIVSDAASVDVSPVDSRVTAETSLDLGRVDGAGTIPSDATQGFDQSVDGAGGSVDASTADGSGGTTTGGVGGSVDVSGPGGSSGFGGSTVAGGAIGTGGIATTGGTLAQGGSGGTPDASLPDTPADAPLRDVPAEGPTPDAPGTCSTDKDCPAQSPLCLANRCAKCASDTDCAGRAGPACVISTGLCVACTANSHCTSDASKAFCVANACVGCNASGASGCSTRTDGKTTCATSGTVAGQCVACSTGDVRCSATGVPQLCNGSGVWEDQTACGTNYACSSTTGKCTCTKTACSSTSCVDTAGTDANNCGSCGHGCGTGGTCIAGQCQPVVVLATGISNYPQILGVDGTYVYYSAAPPPPAPAYTTNAYRVSKSAVSGTAATVALGASYSEFLQVISGSVYNILFFGGRGSYSDCSFSSDSGTCANTTQPIDSPVIPSKNTAQQHFALCSQTSTGDQISWYTFDNNQRSFYNFVPFSNNGCAGNAAAYGDNVYWIRDSPPYTILYSLPFGGSPSPLTASMTSGAYTLLDANTVSVLLAGPFGLYRVALPSGNSNAQPPLLMTISPSTVTAATEDANGIYWIQSDGTLSSCTLSSCVSGTKKTLATGLGAVINLFQDDQSLYWTSNSAGQGLVLRLAK